MYVKDLSEEERTKLLDAFYLWHGLKENTTKAKMKIVDEVLGPSIIPWHKGDTEEYHLGIKEETLLLKYGHLI